MSTPNFPQNHDLDKVKQACNSLMEHFDTVQIFATRHEEGLHNGTINIQYGAGNWFARFGHVHQWSIKQAERERADARNEGRTEEE